MSATVTATTTTVAPMEEDVKVNEPGPEPEEAPSTGKPAACLKVLQAAVKAQKSRIKMERDELKATRDEALASINRLVGLQDTLEQLLATAFPKKVKNALQLFTADAMKQATEQNLKVDAAFIKDCQTKWKTASDEFKAPYAARYKVDLQAYVTALASVNVENVLAAFQTLATSSPDTDLTPFVTQLTALLNGVKKSKSKKRTKTTADADATATATATTTTADGDKPPPAKKKRTTKKPKVAPLDTTGAGATAES